MTSMSFLRISIKYPFILIAVLTIASTGHSHNDIRIIDPKENTSWYHGSNSYRIAWTQTNHAFKWNIELLHPRTLEKAVDICKSISEYKPKEMSYYWWIASDVPSGLYVIRVKDADKEDTFGESRPFSILSQDEVSNISSSAQVFLPSSPHSDNFFTIIHSTQHLHPHEIKHKIHLDNEAQRFKSIDMKDYWPKSHELCTIKRVHRPSRERFLKEFVEKQVPVIITGLMDDWPAMHEWDFVKLGTRLSRGVKVDVLDELSSYRRWNECRVNISPSLRNPPKVHMTAFHELYPELMNDVKIPDIFRDEDDFLQIVDSDIRPPQLSFHMEPKRSGYHWHVEVLNGSLWSALIKGHKRWGLYHPDIFFPPGIVHNKYRMQDDQSSDTFTWWAYTQPHIHADRQPLQCAQGPGEMLYIPSGWWWNYINLDDSIALKRWFCDRFSLKSCLHELKEQSDSSPDNRHADVFIQLRHYLSINYPEILTSDDREFESPVSGLGKTFSELQQDMSDYKYKEYFGKHELGDDAVEDEEITNDFILNDAEQ